MWSGLNGAGWTVLETNKWLQFAMKHKGLLGIFPALLFLLFFFVGGFFQAFVLSIGGEESIYGHEGAAWAYEELMQKKYLSSYVATILLAALVSILSGGIGLLIAFILAVISVKRNWVRIIFQLPFGVPHLLSAYMLTQVLMQTGFLSRIAYHLGLISSYEQFPVLIHDQWGIGFLFAYLWKEIPFIILLTYPFVAKLLHEWKETVFVLGGSFFQMVRWVVLPMLLPIWAGGMWVVFSFVLWAYEIPALMARSSMGLIPVLAWQEYTQFGWDRQPMAIAMNVVLAFVSFLVGLLLIMVQKRWFEKGRRA